MSPPKPTDAAPSSAPTAAASTAKIIPLAEVAKHTKRNDIWMVIDRKVYDMTGFMEDHPGGPEIMLEHAGASGRGAMSSSLVAFARAVSFSARLPRLYPQPARSPFPHPYSGKDATQE